MNANQLLDVIGEVKTEYLSEALATKEKRPARRNVHRIVLIAAIVSLTVLLLGCAVVAWKLQDMKLGEFTYTEPRYIDEEGNKIPATEKTHDVLSLQGIAGSPEYMAAREWFSYEWEMIMNDARQEGNLIENDFDAPEDYDAYLVGNQAMQDKIDEICAKYDLKLLGPIAVCQRYQRDIFFESLGISSLLKSGAEAVMDGGSGYFYANGNFKMEFWLTLTGDEAAYPHEILLSFNVKHKGYFDAVTIAVADADAVDQRHYTLADGTEILIVKSGGTAHIFCDREDAFLSAGFDIGDFYGESNDVMTDRDIELVAEALDFSVKPSKPDMAAAREKLEASEAAWLAEEEKRQESYVDPWVKENYQELIESLRQDIDFEYTYGFADLNGDGAEELLIGNITMIRDAGEDEKSCFTDIFTMKDGKTTLYFTASAATYLCENNGLACISKVPNDWYGFYTTGENGEAWGKYEYLTYNNTEGKWFFGPEGEPWPREITEEEAVAIMDSYPRILMEMKPISEYPMD